MQGSPLLKGQVRKIQLLPRVNRFKITLTEPAIVNPILRLGLDLEVSQGFMITVVTVRALKSMQSPSRSTPRTISLPFTCALQKKQRRKGSANWTVTFKPRIRKRESSQDVFCDPIQ